MKISEKSSSGSARRARLGAYLATVVGSIGMGTSADAGVIPIDLTGFTGDNMGIAPGPGSYFAGRGTFSNFTPGTAFFGLTTFTGSTLA